MIKNTLYAHCAHESATTLEAKAQQIEALMLAEEQAPCPVIHRFGPGIYMRELHMQAGTLAVGHYQNFEHLNVFLKGKMALQNDDGSVTEMTAPMIFVGQPGRKIAYVLEDMVFINVYPTDETDVEKLEAHYLTKSDTFAEHAPAKVTHANDNEDYLLALSELGVSHEEARAISIDESDMIPLPYGGYKFKKSPSQIEGKGIFATAEIDAGEIIGVARLGSKRTILGRFTNHSKNPNAEMLPGHLGEIVLVSKQKISGCKGGQDGEEITIDYREAVKLNRAIGGQECQG